MTKEPVKVPNPDCLMDGERGRVCFGFSELARMAGSYRGRFWAL